MTDLVILNGVKWLLQESVFPFSEYRVEYGNEDYSAHDLMAENEDERSGPRNLDSGLSEISIVFQAAVPKPVAPKYTTSGVRRPSEL